MSAEALKILISGATGWLGKESVARILQKKIEDVGTANLELCSSDGRDLVIDRSHEFPTVTFQTRIAHSESTQLQGFIHLAFLTKDKAAQIGSQCPSRRGLTCSRRSGASSSGLSCR